MKTQILSCLLLTTACVTAAEGAGPNNRPVAAVAPKPSPSTTPATSAAKTKRALVNPFLVDAKSPAKDGAKAFKSCSEPPSAIVDIDVTSYYADKAHSFVDSAKKTENVAALKPLRDYLKSVNRMAEAYAAKRPLDPAPAHCAVKWLATWAKAGALLGKMNNQGGYEQKWALGTVSLAYLATRDAPGQDAAATKEVETWLTKVATQVRTHYEHDDHEDARNNHAYWAGMAVAAAGLAADDQDLFRWGTTAFDIFAKEVASDGTLPLELARKARALHYHAFAVQPLVVLNTMAAANHVTLSPKGDAGLEKLVDLVVKGYSQPEVLAKAAGAKQEKLKPADMAFLEFYAPRKRDPAAQKLLSTLRPLKDDRLGGDVTLLFGH